MISENVRLGTKIQIFHPSLVNLYGCEIGDNTKMGTFVEIQKNAKIGANCKIQSHSFICEGVVIEDNVFIGHGVKFINDKYPKSTSGGTLQNERDWEVIPIIVKKGASIGTNATILCGVTIGENALIGAGSVVTKDVPDNTTVVGNPAKELTRKLESNLIKNEKKVPFLDLKAQYKTLTKEIKPELDWVLENTAFILGDKVESFENNFALYCNKNHAIAVNSGTSALHLALLAKGISPGDEVITVPNTFIATTEAISYIGAKPILVEINKDTYTIDVSKIEGKITEKTKAILPVHLYGQPAEMDEIIKIAEKYNLIIIEDCCQAHGAKYKGKKVPISDTGCFSFYPGKNLGAYGEAGAVVTNNEDLAKKIKILRNHGQEQRYQHKIIGYNYRMAGFQGAVLNTKLKYLDEWIKKRREKAQLYNKLLQGIVEIPKEKEYMESVYHLYIVRVKQREKLMQYLKENGIDTGLHYPIPIHLQEAYKELNLNKGDFPITELYSNEILSLPIFPELSTEQIQHVANKIKDFYNK